MTVFSSQAFHAARHNTAQTLQVHKKLPLKEAGDNSASFSFGRCSTKEQRSKSQVSVDLSYQIRGNYYGAL